MDGRSLEEVPMDDESIETEVMGGNQVLTLITTEDGIPTSTEVTVLTTAFGDVPLMTAALGTLSEVSLGTTHPTFVTSHPGVSTVYATSMGPTTSIIGGHHPGVFVSDGDGRFSVMDSDGVRQTIVVHAADAAQLTSAFAQVQAGVEGQGGSIVFQEVEVDPSQIREITQHHHHQEEDDGRGPAQTLIIEGTHHHHGPSSSILEMSELPTQIIEGEEEEHVLESEELVTEEGTAVTDPPEPQHSQTDAPPQTEISIEAEAGEGSALKNAESVSVASTTTTIQEEPQPPTSSQQNEPETEVAHATSSTEVIPELPPPSPPIPDEVVCLVCYQAFLNPKRKKKEDLEGEKETTGEVPAENVKEHTEESESIESSKETASYGRSLGRFFELSRVNMSIVTRRSYKDYEVPICQSCNKNLVQAEIIIQDLKRLEKELFVLRGHIKGEIINSYSFFRNKENQELAESRRSVPGLVEILEIVDRIREDIINDGRPPKIPRMFGVPSRRGRKPKKHLPVEAEEKRPDSEVPSTDADVSGNDSTKAKEIVETETASVPSDGTEKDSSTVEKPSETETAAASSSQTTTIKPENGDLEEKEVKPAMRTSFGRIIKRPAYMMSELTEEELSELGESSEDDYEEIEVKPDIPMDPAIGEGSDPLAAAAALLPEEMDEEEDPAWCPRKGLILSEKVGIPTSTSEESEELSDYDSDLEAAAKVKVKAKPKKASPKEQKRKRVKKQHKKQKVKQKKPTKLPENVNYEVKVIQLDGTELMTINTTNADDNIGLEPEITQKVMDSQAVIMVKNQLFGKRVQCPHCSRSFTDPTRRDVHVKKKHEGDMKPFGCQVCNKRFGRQDHLRNHMKRHTRPPKDKAFKVKPSTSQKIHRCQFCDQRFRNKSELSIHTRTHTGERPFKCEHCLEGFVSALKREFHIEQLHPEVPPIRCEFCPRGFFRPHRLRIHAVSHTGEKTNICEICGKCFSQAAMLRYHQTTHEELNMKQFKCQECSRVFANPQNLKSHMESQHQKMYRHRCTTCGRGYTQMSHLRRHLRTHSGEQPFGCSYCPKKFTSGAALKIHVRIHTGERPYWCAQCEKGFRSKTKLGRHMKTLIHSGAEANKMKKDATLAEIETMDVTDVNAATSTTWTEIVGIITGV